MGKAEQPGRDEADPQTQSMLESVWGGLSVLNKQIKLERIDGKVHVVLNDPRATQRKERARSQAEAAMLRMREELTELLDRTRNARRALPHLAGVEHALKTQGLAAFDGMPERVLARASQQLDAVLTEPLGPGLTDLRARIVVAQTAIERIDAAAAKHAAPSSFLTDEKLQVNEASVSDFQRAVAESEGKA
jgi:hypothetical protein